MSIDVVVQNNNQDLTWCFTGFYGAPRAEDRHHSWWFLRTLHTLPHSAWLSMGDYNETFYTCEHFSRAARSENHMRAFREVTVRSLSKIWASLV